MFSNASKQKRLDRGKKVFEEMQRTAYKAFVWFGVKVFTITSMAKYQNDNIYAT